jgi:hypothetical protein
MRFLTSTVTMEQTALDRLLGGQRRSGVQLAQGSTHVSSNLQHLSAPLSPNAAGVRIEERQFVEGRGADRRRCR